MGLKRGENEGENGVKDGEDVDVDGDEKMDGEKGIDDGEKEDRNEEKLENDGDKLGYHHAKVNRTLMMCLEYLGLGGLMRVIRSERDMGNGGINEGDFGGKNGENEGSFGDNNDGGTDYRIHLSQRNSAYLRSLLSDNFAVKVIKQLVPPLPPVHYFEDGDPKMVVVKENGGGGDGGDSKNDVNDEGESIIKDTNKNGDKNDEKNEKFEDKNTKEEKYETDEEEKNVKKQTNTPTKARHFLSFHPAPDLLQSDVMLSLTHLLTTLHHCTTIRHHHLQMTLDFKEVWGGGFEGWVGCEGWRGDERSGGRDEYFKGVFNEISLLIFPFILLCSDFCGFMFSPPCWFFLVFKLFFHP